MPVVRDPRLCKVNIHLSYIVYTILYILILINQLYLVINSYLLDPAALEERKNFLKRPLFRDSVKYHLLVFLLIS